MPAPLKCLFLPLHLNIQQVDSVIVHLYHAGAVALFSGFTNGVGQIWLDNVQCRGTETTLAACPHPTFGSHNCVHSEDAGVRCQIGMAVHS